ncbi:MAG TPA: ABC-F family ATP-binding cassette domain-containing protein [Micropruina sp.]|nr:ABC-F family ATP-binding cassette domain-containing protein [Micropruina sp.]
MSASLSLSGVAASFGARVLFTGLDLTLSSGDVTALVGPNGAGKTTLLRIVAGEHRADAGSVRFSPPNAALGYLPQSLPWEGESILAYAARRTGVDAAQAEFEAAAEALVSDDAAAADRYDHALARWLALGGPDLDVRLAEVLAGLDLKVDLARPLGSLSGGQAARASLASILVSRFDVLLLDEPTNNLDAGGLAALTDFLRGLSSPVLIASHDRAFLDEVASSVLELDEAQQQVQHYAGGWTDYRTAKARARQQAEQAYQAYSDQRTELIEQARRKTEWASKGRTKAAKLGSGMKLEKKYREDRARRMDQRAARVRDAVERLPEVDQPRKEWSLQYSINEAAPSSEVVLSLDRVLVHNGPFAVGPITAQVARSDRVALIGANGTGKSTLIDALLGRRPIESGRLTWGTRTRLGVLDQARDTIAGAGVLLDTVAATLGETDAAPVRTLLAKFGLGAEHVGRSCDGLSLGERTRAALAVLQGRAVNVLVLDEPTNHLDAAAIDQLQDALTRFSGTVLIVTHDRALLGALQPDTEWNFTRHGSASSVVAE